jgi:hypothetical protein
MSLEKSIVDLKETVDRLISIIEAKYDGISVSSEPTPEPIPEPTPVDAQEEPPVQKTRGRKPKVVEAKVVEEVIDSSDEDNQVSVDTSTDDEIPQTPVPAESCTITREMLHAAMKEFRIKNGADATRDVMSKYKAKVFSEIRDEDIALIYAEVSE